MMRSLTKKTKAFLKNHDGSETVEMVYTVIMLLTFLMVGLMFLCYVFAVNQVTMATRRVCRDIELSGTIPTQIELDNQFKSLLSGTNFKSGSHSISVRDVERKIAGTSNIQLTGTFTVYGSCEYIVHLISPGNFTGYSISIPITVSINGMSEVYFSEA